MPNYAWTTGRSLPQVENGHVFEFTNFSQKFPHTPIFTGVTGLVFRNCNLVNCDIPPDATVESCNRCQVEFCTNVWPRLVAKGFPACAENCAHVVDSDEIRVGGTLVDTVRRYKNKRV